MPNITSWITCRPPARRHQLSRLVLELPLCRLEAQRVFKAACICSILNPPPITAEKDRDTSGGDLKTS